MVSVYIIPSTPYWLGRIGVKHKSTDSVTVISSDWMVSVYIIPSTSYWLDRVGVVLKSTDWVPVISSDWMVSVYPPAGRGDGAQWCARTISASLLTSCYVPSSYLSYLPAYLLMSKFSSVLGLMVFFRYTYHLSFVGLCCESLWPISHPHTWLIFPNIRSFPVDL